MTGEGVKCLGKVGRPLKCTEAAGDGVVGVVREVYC